MNLKKQYQPTKNNTMYVVDGNIFVSDYQDYRTPYFLTRYDFKTKQPLWEIQLPFDYYPYTISSIKIINGDLYVTHNSKTYKFNLETGKRDESVTYNDKLIGIYKNYVVLQKMQNQNESLYVIDENNNTVYSQLATGYDRIYATIHGNYLNYVFDNDDTYKSYSYSVNLDDLTERCSDKYNAETHQTSIAPVLINGYRLEDHYFVDANTLKISFIIKYDAEFLYFDGQYIYTTQGIYDANSFTIKYTYPQIQEPNKIVNIDGDLYACVGKYYASKYYKLNIA